MWHHYWIVTVKKSWDLTQVFIQIFAKFKWLKCGLDFDDIWGQHLVHIWLMYDWISPNVTVRYHFGTVLERVRGGVTISKWSTFQNFSQYLFFPKFKIFHIILGGGGVQKIMDHFLNFLALVLNISLREIYWRSISKHWGKNKDNVTSYLRKWFSQPWIEISLASSIAIAFSQEGLSEIEVFIEKSLSHEMPEVIPSKLFIYFGKLCKPWTQNS